MDTLSEYRRIIRRLIEEYARVQPSVGDVEIETIFDESKNNYELMYSGWDKHRRIHGIANDLVDAGIPRDRIVLAFKPPDVRQYTDFATA